MDLKDGTIWQRLSIELDGVNIGNQLIYDLLCRRPILLRIRADSQPVKDTYGPDD